MFRYIVNNRFEKTNFNFIYKIIIYLRTDFEAKRNV
jgi:hypothetical protein